jgi:hypothetical protein
MSCRAMVTGSDYDIVASNLNGARFTGLQSREDKHKGGEA